MKALFDFKGHTQAFREIIHLFTRYRELTWEMTKREISDRYAGQAIGTMWAIGHPLLLMMVYIFVFGYIFKVKTGGTLDMPRDYVTYLLSGLIPWITFQESMSKGTTVIVSNASLVKQVVFPIEILPVKGVIASFITQLIFTSFLIIYVLIRYKTVPVSYLFIPFLFSFQVLAMIGVSYILSCIGVYFRDIKDFVQVFCTIGIYVLPVCYLPTMVPKFFKIFLFLNPFSYLIWCFQDIFYFGAIRHPGAWFIFISGATLIFYFGYRIFTKIKITFGNVL